MVDAEAGLLVAEAPGGAVAAEDEVGAVVAEPAAVVGVAGDDAEKTTAQLRRLNIPLKDLPDATALPQLQVAQRFLKSAHASVNSLFTNLATVRGLSRMKWDRTKISVQTRGSLGESQVDLLRAAVVFSGAGIDATLKQLVRDGLPALLEISKEAEKAFAEYISRALTDSAGLVEGRSIAKYLVSADPRSKLIETYIFELTGDSLQSAEQVHRTASALGIADPAVHKEINSLQALFIARNQIVHELDLQPSSKKLSRGRRSRKISEVTGYCNTAFAVTQLIVNRVAAMLEVQSSGPPAAPPLGTRSVTRVPAVDPRRVAKASHTK